MATILLKFIEHVPPSKLYEVPGTKFSVRIDVPESYSDLLSIVRTRFKRYVKDGFKIQTTTFDGYKAFENYVSPNVTIIKNNASFRRHILAGRLVEIVCRKKGQHRDGFLF